jgi:hypothetical protein
MYYDKQEIERQLVPSLRCMKVRPCSVQSTQRAQSCIHLKNKNILVKHISLQLQYEEHVLIFKKKKDSPHRLREVLPMCHADTVYYCKVALPVSALCG